MKWMRSLFLFLLMASVLLTGATALAETKSTANNQPSVRVVSVTVKKPSETTEEPEAEMEVNTDSGTGSEAETEQKTSRPGVISVTVRSVTEVPEVGNSETEIVSGIEPEVETEPVQEAENSNTDRQQSETLPEVTTEPETEEIPDAGTTTGIGEESEETIERNIQTDGEVLRVHQIHLGCAAGYLITQGENVILVDCGTDTDAYAVNTPMLEYLAASGIDHVDVHIVTHYHNDHAMNIDILSELYGTESTVVYGPSRELPSRFCPLPKGEYRQLKDNDVFRIGDLEFTCIGPASDDETGELNKDSLNVLMKYGNHTFMFTGDYVASDMALRHEDLLKTVDVLGFPHHGLQPFTISEKVLRTTGASVVLVPGNTAGTVRVYCQEAWLKPDVYGTSSGNVVVESNGTDMTVFDHVEPGQFKDR